MQKRRFYFVPRGRRVAPQLNILFTFLGSAIVGSLQLSRNMKFGLTVSVSDRYILVYSICLFHSAYERNQRNW